MPWQCKACGANIPEDTQSVCPTCATQKTAWTVEVDRTRTLTVATKKVEILRGVEETPIPRELTREGAQATETVEVLPAERVEELAGRGLAPAPERRLVVRVYPGKQKTVDIDLTLLFDRERPRDLTFTHESPELDSRGGFDTEFVFVKKPPPAPPGLLRRGDNGTNVRRLQQALAARGRTLDVDGAFGPGTQAAVKTFQRTHTLGVDGVVGPQTWAALLDPSLIEIPGVHVVELSEDTEQGYAPAVEVGALGRAPRELPTTALDPATVTRTTRRRAHVLELEDVTFHTDSAVFMPDAHVNARESGQASVTGLAAIATVFKFCGEFRGKQVLVAGHTDTSGAAGYNVTLSELRAQNVLAYLTGDRQGWASAADSKHRVKDWQKILTWLARTRGWDCDPGAVDDQSGPNSRGALDRFRETYQGRFDRPAGEGRAPTLGDWGAFFDCYDLYLSELFAVSPDAVENLRDSVQFVTPGSVGCGESWPVEAVGVDGHPCQANRRVEILIFDSGEEPELTCHEVDCNAQDCPLYGSGLYEVDHLDVEGYAPTQRIRNLQLLYEDGAWMADAEIEAIFEGGSVRAWTDPAGYASLPIPLGSDSSFRLVLRTLPEA